MKCFHATSFVVVAALVTLCVLLVFGSSSIGMIDQGDYPRTVSRIVGEPLPPAADAAATAPVTRWALRDGLPIPNASSGTSSFLFAAAAGLQSLYQDRFDMMHLGLAGKAGLAAALGLLAFAAGRRLGFGVAGQGALAAGLLLTAFAAHNIAFMQSFYGEFSFFLGLPVLLAALLWPPGRWRLGLLAFGLLMCGGAKAQFFYLPLLVLPVLWMEARATGRRLGRPAVATVLLVQVICLLPLTISDVMTFNRHHSTHQGSYLAMTEAERDRLGLDPIERQCIGVDAWGNRLETLDAVRIVRDDDDCAVPWPKSLVDTLRPYAVAPMAALRMVTIGLPPHLTVRYFHVQDDNHYSASLKAKAGPVAKSLYWLTSFRDTILRPWTLPLLLVFVLVVAWRSLLDRAMGLAAPLLLLLLLSLSQVPVALLGEGVRDLSKHLAGAQYALDLMLVLLAGHLFWLAKQSTSRAES
jgi:hypothetical protein